MKRTASQASAKSTNGESAESGWVKAGKRNDKNRTGSSAKSAARLDELLDDRNWAAARALIEEELIYNPSDHWLWLTLSSTYYEEKDYDKALACARRAVELGPACPLALWHYAGALYMSRHETAAFAIWTVLLNIDLDEIAHGEHGEGMDWARQLVNDVHYRIGRYYQWLDRADLARESFQKYLHNRAHGVGSIYDKQTVEALLQGLQRDGA